MSRLVVLSVILIFVSRQASAGVPGLVPAATDSAIHSVLGKLEEAVMARSMEGILNLYAPDSLLRKDVRSRYAGTLVFDSLQCQEHVGAILPRGDNAEASVCQEVTWIEHERLHADFGWRTLELAPGPQGWRIVGDQERASARSLSTDLQVDLDPAGGKISGSARMTVELPAPGEDALLLGLNRGLAIQGIHAVGGAPLDFRRVADVVVVPIPESVSRQAPRLGRSAERDSMTIEVAFDGTFFNESREQGYSQVGISPEGCFASWVTSWYPHVLGVGSKARGRITYAVPSGFTVASSGRRVETTEEGGRSRQVFQINQPLDISFAAAKYYHKSRSVDGIDLGVYFLRGGDAKADLYISSCARVLGFLRRVYGFYPYDGYAVVELPSDAVGTLGGSSEQGMNLFPVGGLPDAEFPLALLSHEIGHSWWGNLVLMDNAAVLDEGLAQMTAVLSVETIAGPKVMRRFLRQGLPGYPQSARDYFARFAGREGRDLPLRTQSSGADNAMILHDLADTKGFFVYEMLREEIGNDAFQRGLRRAVKEYAGREIRLADLERIWERECGRSLAWFFEQWFSRPGAPDFRMSYTVTPRRDGKSGVEGTVVQAGEPYRVTADIVLEAASRAPRVERLAISGRETPFHFIADARPDTILFDPGYRIIRWTDSYRNGPLLEDAITKYSTGDVDGAGSCLGEYLSRVPLSLVGHTLRARWSLDFGHLDAAEREFQWVLEKARLYDTDDPAVTRSEAGLGQIADLRGRRAEAIEWYGKAVASDDGSAAAREAFDYLKTPFSAKSTSAGADPALLQRCAGTYAMPQGFSIVVSMAKLGFLTALVPGERLIGLRLEEGTRFRAVTDEPVTLQFEGGDAAFQELTVESSGRTFHLQRKD
jgi:hypothetical protein